jgi:hypothetical protein
MRESNECYKDRTPVLAIIGALLLLVGVAAAFLGPAEMYCFYLFSEGGRFHYEGFGFGSLVFGSIAWQIIGYYAIALLFIPLGYGHLRPRRWVRVLSLSLLWCGLIVGLPLMIVFLSMLSVKELSLTAALLVIVALGLSYLTVPGLLIRFYKSQAVRQTFEAKDTNSYWIERLPTSVLVLAVLFTFYIVVLHVPIFFNGIFPLFGIWLSDIQGVLALDISIVSLACLTWGVLRQRAWAWWGSVGYFGLLTSSLVMTLIQSSFSEMLSLMRFPPTEMDLLEGMPLQGVHFAPFIGIPLVMVAPHLIVVR